MRRLLVLPAEAVRPLPSAQPGSASTPTNGTAASAEAEVSGAAAAVTAGAGADTATATTDAPQPFDKHGDYMLDMDKLPAGCLPMMVFVNTESGGRKGAILLRQLRQILHPLQVVRLQDKGAAAAMLTFFEPVLARINSTESAVGGGAGVATRPCLRALCCGGDGTVGWVLNTIRDAPAFAGEGVSSTGQRGVGSTRSLTGSASKVAVGILPLGTGNDLSRVLGWGSGLDEKVTSNYLVYLLSAVAEATPSLLDRWQCEVTTEEAGGAGGAGGGAGGELSEQTTASRTKQATKQAEVQNYMGVGIDAQVGG